MLSGSEYLAKPRNEWDSGDPIIFAEGFYAVAIVLAFSRILYFLKLSCLLGPMQIAIGRMMEDVMRILVIFLVVICSFAFGMYRLLIGYEGMEYRNDENIFIQPQTFDRYNIL
jgi:hypothetical protein